MNAQNRDLSVSPVTYLRRLYRFEAQLELNSIGLVPEGLRMANRFEGHVREGMLVGARVWGIDHFVIRSDGVGLIDAEKTLSLGGLHVYEHVRAYCLPPAGLLLPELSALLAPDFEWPDVDFPMQGFSFFRAAHPELCALNRAVAHVRGHGNFRTGALSIETFLMPQVDGRTLPAFERFAPTPA
jgi:hypothetical protein